MNVNIYSIYDDAAGAYTQPFFMQNDGLAIRVFQDNVNSKEENNISVHPDQFTLFRIGSWDDSKGMITQDERPKSLGNGLHFKTEQAVDIGVEELQKIRSMLESLENSVGVIEDS